LTKKMNSFLAVFLLLSAPTLLVSFVLDSKQVKPRSPLPTAFLSKESEDAEPTTKQFPTLVVSEMPAPLPDKLKNHYYFLRHGQSTANVAEVISSDRSLAYSDRHGVTTLGYEQGFQSAKQLLDILSQEELQPGDKVLFVTSPFARARQTAQACLDGLAEQDAQKRIQELGIEILPDVIFEDRLMERYFGRLDNEAIYTYAYVWPLDGFNVTHTAFDVESVAAVCTRLSQVVDRFESEYDQGRHHIVWVSHADVLQIAQLYGANAENVGIFSSYRFKNGEVRIMKRTPDSLPEPDPLPAPQRGTGI
jgi:broad specificity phosphatase PhoE